MPPLWMPHAFGLEGKVPEDDDVGLFPLFDVLTIHSRAYRKCILARSVAREPSVGASARTESPNDWVRCTFKDY